MANRWMLVGAILAGLGVAAGAFGAHALGDRVPPDLLEVFDTATRYHLVHALALLAVGLAADARPHGLWDVAGALFTAGILVFGGSLYALSLSGLRWLGAITPIGGVCFLAGWVVFALAALRSRPGA